MVRRELLSRVASLFVIDVGALTEETRTTFQITKGVDSRMVRYGRYHDAILGGTTDSQLLASAHVDSECLRAAERHLDAFLRSRGACLDATNAVDQHHLLEHPHAVVSPHDIVMLKDCMATISTKYCGNQEQSIAQLERRDADHAREVRALKTRLRLRDEQIRLKDYELELRGYEINLRTDEANALRARCDHIESLLQEDTL